LLKPPQGAVIQLEPDPVLFHELSDTIWFDTVLDQIANVIEGKPFLGLREPWQRVNNHEKYRQNGTRPHRTDDLRKANFNFPTVMLAEIL
jgi:hypothetical protein